MQNLKEKWQVLWKMTWNLANFHVSSRKSKNLHFLQSTWSFRWKSTEELCFMTLKSNATFETLTLGSRNDMRNLVNFNGSSGKSQNLHFDVLLLWKLNFVWGKKGTEKLSFITLKIDAKFEEKLTCRWKMTWGIWWIFDPTLRSLKVCTLTGPFWWKYIMSELKNYRRVMCHDTEAWCNF